uniref:leukotriene-B4 omega-hydroxylase 3-like isoform X1 n=1 Tax=Ciona intestinalis TaxID=7719 RepID=UPI000052314A|nr:leukotriene-B4 omega-hydroxylase 3-like isoform X1 [Ciona intestinalis]|eukprot:XP_002125043.1 leukotriene-B4 omega-hydroxylase 3-like isoform X1 [Ciona intestinalis]
MTLFEAASEVVFLNRGFVLSSLISEVVLLIAIVAVTKVYLVPAIRYYKRGLLYTKQGCSPPRHWLWGHLTVFPLSHDGMLKRLRTTAQYAGMFVSWAGPFTYWIETQHPTTCAVLANSSAPKAEFLYGCLRPWIGDGLLTSKGSKWKRNRRLLTPAFHFEILKPYLNIFNKSSYAMLEKWKRHSGQSYDVYGDVSNLTLDTMMQCAMSTDTDSGGEDGGYGYINAVHELTLLVMERVYNPLHMIDWIYHFSSNGRRFRKLVDFVHETSETIIKERKKELETLVQEDNDNASTATNNEISSFKKRGTKHLDFLDILLQTKDENGNGLTLKEIRDEVDTFLFEGHDTTASGIAWCLYNLAKHPEYQQRCREEVLEEVGEKEKIEWEDLSKLTYLAMCIKESLRLNPPVFCVGRELNEDLTFNDKYTPCKKMKVESGNTVLMQIMSMHRNPHVWENPEVYDPERFSAENMKNRHSMSFLAFSAGPRNCIGRNFAMNELRVVIGQTLRQYKLWCDDDTPQPKMQPNIILRSANGIHIKFKPV